MDWDKRDCIGAEKEVGLYLKLNNLKMVGGGA